LFRAESVRGVEALRGFPLPVAATAFTALCPSDDRLATAAAVRRSQLRPQGNIRDYCTWKVRSRQSGFTRDLSAEPLSAFCAPLRNSPLSLGSASR
jgi:hypothetical protein